MAAAGLVLCGCCQAYAAKTDTASREFFAMDTVMSVTVYGEGAEESVDEAVALVNRLDAELSTGNEKSEVSRINSAGKGMLSEDGSFLMKRALSLYEDTGGLFDITIYPVMELWGFTDGNYRVPEENEIEGALALVDASRIEYDETAGQVVLPEPGMKIDFGGIAKGYTSSCMAKMLRERGIEHAIINLGGNVQTVGTKPDGSLWRIGVRDPVNTDSMVGVLSISDTAVITSGGYERFFEENGERYHHIINPETGYPADSGLSSVTVITSDGTMADGLSTFLYIAGEEKACEYWHKYETAFDMILVRDDGSILVTEGVSDNFSTDRDCGIIYMGD